MKLKTLILAALAVSVLGAQAHARGKRRPRRKWRDRVRKEVNKGTILDMKSRDPQKPLDWLTDFDRAAEIAGREKRPLLIVFTSEELARTSTSCRFKANNLRRAARKAKVVPLKLMPPVMLDTKGIPKKEAAKRRELYAKAQKRYREVVRQFRVAAGPCLVMTAPDAKSLSHQVTPTDAQTKATLDRLGEMLAAHEKALGKKPAEAKKDGDKPKEAEAKKPEEKPAEKKPEVDPEDDF